LRVNDAILPQLRILDHVARIPEKTVCDAGLVEELTLMGRQLRAKDFVHDRRWYFILLDHRQVRNFFTSPSSSALKTSSSLRAMMRAETMFLRSVSVYQQERPIHVREDSRPKRRTVPGYR
jgi:hypothetical protein